MKRLMALVLCAACILALGACGKKEPATGLSNPWKSVETMEEASSEVGFSMVVPDTVEGYEAKTYRVCTPEGSRIIEVTFRNVNDDTICIRKGEGSEDISGDYNQYDAVGTVEVAGISVNMRANGESVRVATWQDGGFTYSTTFSAGMENETAAAIIAQVR